MKSPLPASIRVLGQKVIVTVTDEIEDCGDYNDTKRQIRINPDFPAAQQQQTLFHEALHASLAVGGVGYALPADMEEAIVRCIENGLWPLIKFK